MVKARKLRSFPVPAVFTPRLDNVKWSADNQVILLHCKGGVVHDLSHGPSQNGPDIVTRKSVLPSPPLAHNLSTVYINDDLFVGGNKSQVLELFLDRIITPRGFDGIEFDNYFLKVDWSRTPLNSGPLDKPRCVLATLTSNFHMTIYNHLNRTRKNTNSDDKLTEEWVIHLDISKLYNGIMYHKWALAGEANSDLRFDQYKSKLYLLTTVDFAWISPFINEGSDETFMMTAQANGDILIWWIVVSPDSGELTAEPVFTKRAVEDDMISAMRFHRVFGNVGVLAVGTNKGIVKVFRMEKLSTETGYEECNQREPKFTMNEGFEIWEKDMMRIEFLETANSQGQNILKGPTVNLLIIKHPNYILSTLITISIDDIDFKPVEDFQSQDGPIVGISQYSENEFLLSHETGTLSLVIIKNGCIGYLEESIISIQEENTSDTNESYLYNGIALSPNRALFCVGKSLSCTFDHLAIRDPGKMIFFSLLPEDNPFGFVQDLYVLNAFSVPKISDALIALRYHIRLNKDYFMDKKVDFTKAYLKGKRLFHLTEADLGLYYWVIKACYFSEFEEGRLSPNEIKAHRRVKVKLYLRHHQVEDIIIRRHCSLLLRKVEENKALPGYELAGKNAESFQSMRKYLESKPDRVPSEPVLETDCMSLCPLCKREVDFQEPSVGSVIPGVPWDSQMCAKKHKIPICILSLLPCGFPYRICRFCRVTSLIAPVFGQQPICPLCGELMLPIPTMEDGNQLGSESDSELDSEDVPCLEEELLGDVEINDPSPSNTKIKGRGRGLSARRKLIEIEHM